MVGLTLAERVYYGRNYYCGKCGEVVEPGDCYGTYPRHNHCGFPVRTKAKHPSVKRTGDSRPR